jgi:hypothetical protein
MFGQYYWDGCWQNDIGPDSHVIFLKSKENCARRLEEISMSVGMSVGCVEVKIISWSDSIMKYA